jgi:CRP/FNR family cyclic AMP-dependent transcriptional regulator
MTQDIQLQRFADKQRIVTQGERGDKMYVVRSGKVRIFRDSGGDETTLAVLEPGAFFGEMALFDSEPRMATAAAVGEAEVRVVSKAEFERLECDPLIREMLVAAAARLRELGKQFEKLSLADDRRQKYVASIPLRHSWTDV